VIPLAGKGGSPIKLAFRKEQTKELDLQSYRANLHKETLELKQHKIIPESKTV
jgi:hypothetical protein